MNSDSFWYYGNGDPTSSSVIGPVGEMHIAEAIRKGTIDSQTQLRHVRITQDRWLPLSALDFNTALEKYDQANTDNSFTLDKYFTGHQLIAIGLLLSVIGIVFSGAPRGDGMTLAIGFSIPGVLFLLAGTIRWAIQPLVDVLMEDKKRQKRSGRKTEKNKPQNLLSDPDRW